jgi:cytochrome c oxidase subunit 4
MSANSLSKKGCWLVWIGLMLLLLTTWGVAQFSLGAANTVLAMLISAMKMSLVILFFMQVRYHMKLIWFFAAAGFVWLLIMITLTLTDYNTRRPVTPYNRGTASQIQR